MTKKKAKATAQPQTREPGYAGHFKGSRKESVHKTYDAKGREAAIELGLKLGLQEGTLRGWAAAWQRTSKPKPKPKAASKKKANGTAAVAAS